jgi:hypothetical protein
VSPLDDGAAAVARLTGALERQAEELRSLRTQLGVGAREAAALLRAEEVAARLAKSRAWVYRNQHVLGGFRIGGQLRFDAEGIDRYLRTCRDRGASERRPQPARLLPVSQDVSSVGGRERPPVA